jgi:hypothetical protein
MDCTSCPKVSSDLPFTQSHNHPSNVSKEETGRNAESLYAGFEVLSVVLMKIPVLWDLTQYLMFKVIPEIAVPQHGGTMRFCFIYFYLFTFGGTRWRSG